MTAMTLERLAGVIELRFREQEAMFDAKLAALEARLEAKLDAKLADAIYHLSTRVDHFGAEPQGELTFDQVMADLARDREDRF